MLHASPVRFARYVGVAPGTTTVSFGSASGWLVPQPEAGGEQVVALPNIAPVPYEPVVPDRPVDPWLIPQPTASNALKVLAPPQTRVTPPATLRILVPPGQAAHGPAPTDIELERTLDWMPVHEGWIETTAGSIYNLGAAKGKATAKDWAVFALVAVAGTALLAGGLVAYDFLAPTADVRRRSRRRY